MSIRAVCPSCDKVYNLDDYMRGKRALCNVCKRPFEIPPASREERREDSRRTGDDRIAPASGPRGTAARSRRDDADHTRQRPAERSRVRDQDNDPVQGKRSDRSRRDDGSPDNKTNLVPILAGVTVGLVVAIGLLVGGMVYALKGKSGPSPEVAASSSQPRPAEPIDNAAAPAGGGEAAIPAGAVPSEMAANIVQKVKQSTVYLRVSMPGGTAEGSGFFAVERGTVITNAHVLGMLRADSRPPRQVDVVINSGETGETRMRGTVLNVDRTNDLAVLRVEGDSSLFPPPLPVDSASKLIETQKVYIFGFPFGSGLGKNITVSTSSITSLRRDSNGILEKVQVNGGMHPGNSGGPVTDARGVVVGVSVSGILNTSINFAIPADFIRPVVERTNRESPDRSPPRDPLARDDPPEMPPPGRPMGPGGPAGPGRPAGPPRGSGLQGDLASLRGVWQSGDVPGDGGGGVGTIKLHLAARRGSSGGIGKLEIATKSGGRTTSSSRTFTFSLRQQGANRIIFAPGARGTGLALIYGFEGGQLILTGIVSSRRISYTLRNVSLDRTSADPGDFDAGTPVKPGNPGNPGSVLPPALADGTASTDALKFSGDVYDFVQTAVQERRIADVDIRGFTLGKGDKDRYRDVCKEGGVLIGFQVGLGRFVNNLVVKSWRPIFLTKAGEKFGKWQGPPPARPGTVKAKPGYVVSGMAIRTGLGVDGFTLTFARLGKNGLDLDDTYNSPQVGGLGGNLSSIGGKGALFVGVTGYLSLDQAGHPPCALGLVAVLPKE